MYQVLKKGVMRVLFKAREIMDHLVHREGDRYGLLAISDAVREDKQELIGIDRQSFATSWLPEDWELVFGSDSYRVKVAARVRDGKRSGPIEGYIVYGDNVYIEGDGGALPRSSCVLSIAVLCDCRGQGVGTRLLDSVHCIGLTDVHAHVSREANEAIGLLGKRGFQCVDLTVSDGLGYIHMVNKKINLGDPSREGATKS